MDDKKPTAQCPDCDVAMDYNDVTIASKGPYDRMDDQSQDRSNVFVCPKCRETFSVNNRTQVATKLPRS